jgi:hypothetical protein
MVRKMRDLRLSGFDYYEVVINFGTDNEVVKAKVEHEVFMVELWRQAFLQSKNNYEVAKQLVAKAVYGVERFADATVGSSRFFAYNNDVVVE